MIRAKISQRLLPVLFLVFFPALAHAQAAQQVGKVMRSEELIQQERDRISAIGGMRLFRFDRYSVTGYDLTGEQKRALDQILQRKKSIFLTAKELDVLIADIKGLLLQENISLDGFEAGITDGNMFIEKSKTH